MRGRVAAARRRHTSGRRPHLRQALQAGHVVVDAHAGEGGAQHLQQAGRGARGRGASRGSRLGGGWDARLRGSASRGSSRPGAGEGRWQLPRQRSCRAGQSCEPVQVAAAAQGEPAAVPQSARTWRAPASESHSSSSSWPAWRVAEGCRGDRSASTSWLQAAADRNGAACQVSREHGRRRQTGGGPRAAGASGGG